LGYNDTISKLELLLADSLLNCNVQSLLETFGANMSYAYLFAEGAGLHGEQGPSTFYTSGPAEDTYRFGMMNEAVARVSQDWMVNFVAHGNPNDVGLAPIPVYGKNHTRGLLSNNGVGTQVVDHAQEERCEFWQQALLLLMDHNTLTSPGWRRIEKSLRVDSGI
jgi:carboxylesterase type B